MKDQLDREASAAANINQSDVNNAVVNARELVRARGDNDIAV